MQIKLKEINKCRKQTPSSHNNKEEDSLFKKYKKFIHPFDEIERIQQP